MLGRWRWAGLAANCAYLVLVLVFVPIAALVLVSFQDAWTGRFEWSRLTLHNYAQVLLHEETARRGLQNTSVIATVGATLAVLICLGLLEPATSGRIDIGERTVFDGAAGVFVAPEKRGIGMVFQSYAIWPHMSVASNVGFPLRIAGISRAETARRVEAMLETVGLGGVVRVRPRR